MNEDELRKASDDAAGVGRLESVLRALPPAAVKRDRWDALHEALVRAWPFLRGSDDEGTTADKLWRAEAPAWDGKHLTFTLERHGATVNGSSRAELHKWSVDPVSSTATIVSRSRRQLSKMSSRVDVRPIADELTKAILAGAMDARLKWTKAGEEVRILVGAIDELGGVPETAAGRRRRFRAAVVERLRASGWEAIPGRAPHTYGRGSREPSVPTAELHRLDVR